MEANNSHRQRAVGSILKIKNSSIRNCQCFKAIRDYNINYKRFSDASEAEIRQAVEVISRSHPNAGESIVMGHLRARGFHVQRSRVRSAIHHNNPNGPMSRFHPPIRRRVYSVPCPNYVWHIDGNHRLVRWRMDLLSGFTISNHKRMIWNQDLLYQIIKVWFEINIYYIKSLTYDIISENFI